MSIKPSQSSYHSLECIWISPVIRRWRLGMFWKTWQNNLLFCKHSQKGQNRTVKSLFFSLYCKSFPIQIRFEQLSRSMRWRMVVIKQRGVFHPRLGLVGADIFNNFCFFVHNFRYRYARKSFKGSKDADFDLVSKKSLGQKNGPMGSGPGPTKGDQKKAKKTHLCRSPREPPPKTKNFFFYFG